MALYPLKFEPIYKAKVWGGRSLAALGKTLPGDEAIGESWELVDLGQTMASGGGGGAERSVVANGPLAGQTLGELIGQYGTELMGGLKLSAQGGFPLLCKYLDARENLSVQVHPSAGYVTDHPDAFLKSEAWYVVAAEEGAVIYKGVKEGVTPQQFAEAIADDTVVDLLIAVPVKVGDMHYLPSGTCHALGAGIVVAEVQTPSDTTFRVYDWGRAGRELHVDQALQCIHFGPAETKANEPGTTIERDHSVVTTLVRCEHFRVERVTMTGGYGQPMPTGQPRAWMVLGGEGRLRCAGESECTTPFAAGQTLLLPAAVEDLHVELDSDATWLDVSFPQIDGDLIA
jgi:mannose-6-phosphate isomerase